MEFEDEVIELDCIDHAIEGLAKELSGEEEYDEADLDIISELIDGMIDEGEILELPADDVGEEEKQMWVDESVPKIREALKLYGDHN